MTVLLAAVATLVSVHGCGDDDPAGVDAGSESEPFDCDDPIDAPDDGGPLPPDVVAVLEAKCYACHADPPMRFAPMKLTTWADFQGCHLEDQHAPNYERMRIRINNERQPMPPILEPQLTEEERATLDSWARAGAPPGE